MKDARDLMQVASKYTALVDWTPWFGEGNLIDISVYKIYKEAGKEDTLLNLSKYRSGPKKTTTTATNGLRVYLWIIINSGPSIKTLKVHVGNGSQSSI